MAGQTWVVHRAYGRVVVQLRGDSFGVLLVLTQAHVQGTQAAQGEVAVERRAGEAVAVAPPLQLFNQRRIACHHRAADHVAVAIDVLGGRVHHHVRAEQQRLLQRRRQECVVHH